MELLSQQPLFSTEPETKGFDLSSGKKWIYPENYPIRQYQFTIVQTSLFHNTLVCLPTGLGKTFIAAVVMYNFWRWYPSGLIVFLAPTKPLVAQQIDACHDIMGIPISETIELTGATKQKQREIAWRNKRVIFATPQTFQKDLEKGIVKTENIKCVVIDEAHRALGKHSYCESIRLLHQTNRYHRLLALSATPGGKLDAVQDVIRNLHITHLELRDDASPDIAPYINERKLEIIQVDLGEDLTRFHERYMGIMDPYFRVLLKSNVLRGATSNITKGRIFHIKREFMNRPNKPYNFGSIVKTLNILMSMCHANELLINHGLRAFVHFYQNHSDKPWLKDEPDLMVLIEDIQKFIGPFPVVQSLMDGNATTIPDDIVFGHGKFHTLRDILMKHFRNAAANNVDTRAIVFVEYRDIVNEVFVLLLQLRPLIKPQVFVGQAGLKQKQQKKALDDFRMNSVNVLISTSVGEEGLDVGEVDLIICFDIMQNSPTRLVQRMGRTGRKRDGHIIVLVTDGREQKTLKSALARRDSLNNKVLHSSEIIEALGEESPRMIPSHLNPECLKMIITSIPATPRSKKQRKKMTTKADEDDLNGNETEITKKRRTAVKKKPSITKSMPNTIMKFLAASSNRDNIFQDDDDVVNMRIEEVRSIQSQLANDSSQRLKPSDVKLLSSDNESVEFLTLCTMKQSAQDMNHGKTPLNISYLPICSVHNLENVFLDFEIPSRSILDCIENLEKYIAPLTDEGTTNEVDDEEMWHYDRFSHFADNSRCPELVLTEGRFEELLDDTSDSDQTVFSGYQSFADQQDDWGKNNAADINICQEDNHDSVENSTRTNSIVIGGAFEDLLDESSDDSVIQYPRNIDDRSQNFGHNIVNGIPLSGIKSYVQDPKEIPKIDLTTSQSENFAKDENNSNVNEPAPHNDYIEDEQRKTEGYTSFDSVKVESNLDIDFGSDFGSWDNCPNENLADSTSTLRIDSVKNRCNTPYDSSSLHTPRGIEQSQQTQTFGNQMTKTNLNIGRTSPDLSKSSQRKVHPKLNILSKKIGQPMISEPMRESIDKRNPTDDDVFGIESLLLDSDFEDQPTVVRKLNTAEKSDIVDDKSIMMMRPLVTKENIVQNKKITLDSSNAHSVRTNSVTGNEFVEDFDWSSSDFETSSTPITESGYFKKAVDLPRVFASNMPENTRSSPSETSEKENQALNSNTNSKVKLCSIREKFLSKVRLNSRQNVDCNNDFTPEKIEKNVFGELKHGFSVVDNFCGDPSRLTAGSCLGHSENIIVPKPSSTKNSDEFVMPSVFMPKKKIEAKFGLSRAGKTRSCSLDSYPNRKRRIRKRHRVKNAFIDDEAEVSSDEMQSSGSSGDDGGAHDEFDDFVSHSQYHDTTVDMRAHYLQSVNSPRRPGRFLIKRVKSPPPDMQIYSQAIQDEPNTYLYDSFCVGDGEPSEHSDDSVEEMSMLTAAERKLTERKRKRRNSLGSIHVKRKRIVVNMSDDSSEDETEKMRAEIANQSMMLKK